MKKVRLLIVLLGLLALVISALMVPFIVLNLRTIKINSDYSHLSSEYDYKEKVEVTGLNLVTQHISCGYATIEMLSDFYSTKVTEDDLSAKNNGKISTQSTGGFLKEINDSIKNKTFVSKKYLTNDEYLKEIYKSLKNNNPVAIEWAAKYEGEWTLHFSIVTMLDIRGDKVTVYNPYGYIENLSISEFINRTTFIAYENMPLFLKFGFAFNAFHKNTLFIVNE